MKDRGRRAEGGARGWQCGRGGASERAREREKEKREKNRFPGNSSLIRSSFFFSSSSSNFRRHAGIHLVSLGARNLMIREFSFLSHTHKHTHTH